MADSIDKVCYDLPTDKNPSVFGPVYWNAFHDLASRIPCDGCKEHAESFITYWHDLVNIHTGKPIYDQVNFDTWVDKTALKSKKVKILLGFSVLIIVVLIVYIIIKKK